MDKKGQNEWDLASPVIAALRRGITGLRVGNVQVVSESNPNPLAAIRKTLYANQWAHNHPHPSKGRTVLLLPRQNPITLLDEGQRKAAEMIKVGKGLLNLYKFSPAQISVEEGIDRSL